MQEPSHSHYPSPLQGVHSWRAADFVLALDAAVMALGEHAANLNALNVFPVADRDTGTNLLLTVQAALQAVRSTDNEDIAEVIQQAARAALRAAHGNSGIILSQFFLALAESTHQTWQFDAHTFAEALNRADFLARQAILQPVEGTMITALRAAAHATLEAVLQQKSTSLSDAMRAARNAAIEAMRHTPDLLPLLHGRGVVDAGARGLAIILDAWAAIATGESLHLQPDALPPEPTPPSSSLTGVYCFNALLSISVGSLESIRSNLSQLGQSIELVSDDLQVRVHLHTDRPEAVVSTLRYYGTLHSVVLDSLTDAPDLVVLPEPRPEALVLLSTAPGIAAYARRLGAGALTLTQSMGANQLSARLAELPVGHLLLLPEDERSTMLAQSAAALVSRPEITVIPVPSVAVQLSVLLSIDPEHPLAGSPEKFVSLSTSIRSLDIFRVSGQGAQPTWIFSVGHTTVRSSELAAALLHAAETLAPESAELCTLVIGEGVSEVNALRRLLAQRWPHLTIELFWGHQQAPALSLALD